MAKTQQDLLVAARQEIPEVSVQEVQERGQPGDDLARKSVV